MYRGIHFMLDYTNVVHSEPVVFCHLVEKIIDQAIQESEINKVNQCSTIFDDETTPPGFTMCFLIDESHITAHSYSNLGMLAIDIFTCGDIEKGKKARNLINQAIKLQFPKAILKQEFSHSRFPK